MFFRFLIFVLGIYISVFSFANDNLKIICKKEDSCNVVAKIDGKNKIILKDYERSKIHINWLSKDLAQLLLSCGSPCNYSTFIDFKNNLESKKSYYIVIAVDPISKKVAYINDNEKIEVSNIFSDKKIIIDLDFSKSLSIYTAIDKVKITHNKISINYYAGEDEIVKNKVIDISKLNN